MVKVKRLKRHKSIKTSSFSKAHLIAFITVFAVIGGTLLLKSNAAPANGTYFATVPSAAVTTPTGLPRSDSSCSALVAANTWEPRSGTNTNEVFQYNDSSHPKYFNSGNYPANNDFPTSAGVVPWSNVGNTESGSAWLAKQAQVDGRYSSSSTTTTTTGVQQVTMSVSDSPFTTDQILRWAACKWGLDENILRAQAVQETDWHSYEPGDCNDTASTGAPWGAGTCESYSILQIKDHNSNKTYGYGGWPYTQVSTSLGADFYAMHLRSCFDGDSWVQQVTGWPAGKTMAQVIAQNGADYAYYGCIGQWFSGSWYDSGAQSYINSVKQWLNNKTWLGYSGTSPDSTAPVVSITSPTTGSNVSGTVALTANATDNMGVQSVQFKLDGTNLGSPVAPTVGNFNFTYSWNTTGLSNGTHTLTAVATDGTGNSTTSANVNVTAGSGNTVTANVFMSTTGSDTGTNCKRFTSLTDMSTVPANTACATTSKAISLAQPGDIVQLEPGSYGAMTISRQSGVDSPKVVIRGDPSLVDQQTCVESQATWQSASPVCPHGNVLLNGFNVICGHGMSIQDMDTTNLTTQFYVGFNSTCPIPSGNEVNSNHDIDITNSHFTYESTLRGTNLTVSHTRIGPNEQVCSTSPTDHTNDDGDNLHIWPDTTNATYLSPVNITLDHNLIYDAQWGPTGTKTCGWQAHTDLVQTLGYNNLTVTNNIFWGGADSSWQDGLLNGTTIGNAVFRNNFFGPSGCCLAPPNGGSGSIQIGNADPTGACANGPYTFENNTLDNGSTFSGFYCSGTGGSNSIIRNNYISNNGSCVPSGAGAAQAQWSYNVFAPGATTCGSNIKTCTPAWLYTPAWSNGQPWPVAESKFTHGWDLHLSTSDTCLKGAGDPANFAPTDFDGQNRVAGTIDAGADAITTGSGGGSCPTGDANGDCHVTIVDLSILLSHYGQSGQTTSTGDFNGDGSVTILDLSILLSHYGL